MDILIVEDDSIILKGLTKGIAWNKLGISDVRGASDGEIATEMLFQKHVDILLTDINMPFMDGLELTRHVNKNYPETLVIFFSEYETFSYAKEAISLGVFDYLLKPVLAKDLILCVKKAISSVESRMQINKGLGLLQNEFFSKLFTSQLSNQEISEQCHLLGLKKMTERCSAATIHLETLDDTKSTPSKNLILGVFKVIKTCIGDKGYVWMHRDEYLYLIAEDSDLVPFKPKLELIFNTINSRYDIPIVITYGKPQDSLATISCSASEALSLQYQYGSLSLNKIIGPLEDIPERNILNTESIVEVLRNSLYAGEEEKCLKIVKSIEANYPIRKYNSVAIALMFHVHSITKNLQKQLTINEDFIDFDLLIEKILTIQQVPEPFEILSESIKRICRAITSSQDLDPVNSHMLSIIHANYSNKSLSLTSLGDSLKMSPAYLCSIFTMKNKTSFSKYLTNLRMEQACTLLASTNKKSYEIAAQIGFASSQYFCKRFKLIYGVTPKQYRESCNI